MAEAVKVIVRCRPLNAREKNLKCENVIEMDSGIGQCRLRKPNEKSQPPKAFTFDGVFNIDSITENIYADICFPLVEGCVEGYNGTVFAYGQTGCGKSFTMQGIEDPPTQRGIIPRAFEHIFESIQVTDDAKFLVRASYLEIYNEDIRDLISKDQKTKLEVKENPDKGVYVKDLLSVPCHSVRDMEKVMEKGGQNRSVGATLMNADSSRSHSIFTIYVEMCEVGADGQEHIRAGKLNLVDLAGSERQAKTGATGDRLKEATKINLSLSALGNVISALVDSKSKHIPYRDSKLTRLLQDSLGGNTKTLMVACISPADNNYDETLSTLRYANRAKNIKNKPKINEDPKDALLREYQGEIEMLKKLLTGQMDMSPDLVAKLGLNSSAAIPTVSKTKPDRPPPPDQTNIEVQKETDRIKREYEEKLQQMQQKYDDAQMSKEKLAQEVAKLQEDLSNTLQASSKLSGFSEENAEAILAEFQSKAVLTDDNDNKKVAPGKQTGDDKLSEHRESKTSVAETPSKEVVGTHGLISESSSILKEFAAKGIGILKDKLSGSNTNLAVSISKQGDDFAEADIHVSENQETHVSPKKILGQTVGNMAVHIQEEAVKRLASLQEQLVGPEKQPNNKEELKRKHKQRKDHAMERQKKMMEDVKKWEGEGIMVKVYDNLQDEIKVKNKCIVELEAQLQASTVEIDDLQCEFQAERVDYLDTIRKLEKEIALQNAIINKVQPTIRRDCNYYNIDRMKILSEYDEETGAWAVPDLKVERTTLPKANLGDSPRNHVMAKQQSSTQEKHDYYARDDEDKYAAHLNNSKDDFSNKYFKSKRAERLLSSSNPVDDSLHSTNNGNLTKPPQSVERISPLNEPVRRPQKLEALPISRFEKKKKKNKTRDL